MAQPRFKVGDYVVCRDCSTNAAYTEARGDTGMVVDVEPTSDGKGAWDLLHVNFDGHTNKLGGMFAHRFDLTERVAAKPVEALSTCVHLTLVVSTTLEFQWAK